MFIEVDYKILDKFHNGCGHKNARNMINALINVYLVTTLSRKDCEEIEDNCNVCKGRVHKKSKKLWVLPTLF